ncbi:hypothetical protein [Aquifex aeolicus]|nr:hypothetical protein [Aquifex aeolicus]
MKTLEKSLEDSLKIYVSEALYTDIEDFKVDYPTALDFELTQVLLIREDLAKNKENIPQQLLDEIRQADKRYLDLYEQVKDLKTKNPHIQVAIKVLKALVELIKTEPI